MELAIIPECFVDTNLVETITEPIKGYNHQKGCNKVTGLMQGKLNNSFAVGIIDKDKKEVPYLRQFEMINNKESLFLYKHKEKDHYIIQISPAVESWIIMNLNEVQLSLEDYGLPSDIKQLTKVSKKVTSKNDVAFRNLFKDLKKMEANGILTLRSWINYLKENTYQSTIEDIQKL